MERPRGSAVLAAFRSCIGRERSWVLRAYAPVGTLVAAFALVLVALAFPTWVARVEGSSAPLLLGPGLLVLGGLAVAGGAVAPLLFAARRLPDPGRHHGHERAFGALGFGYVTAVYLGFVVSAPSAYRTAPDGPMAPVIEWLYGLDPLIGVIPPAVVLAVLLVYHRLGVP